MFEHYFSIFVLYVVHFLEIMGVLVIVSGAVKAFYVFVRSGFDPGASNIKLDLAKALALSLEFKLGGEILRTVITKTLDEMLILAFIIALRVVLTFVIHYEIKFDTDEHSKKTE